MNIYQNYKFCYVINDDNTINSTEDVLIYAFSLENAKAKANQFADSYGIEHGKIWYKYQIESVKENYTRSFFEALLLHKGIYGDFIMQYGFDYTNEVRTNIVYFDDGIGFIWGDLFDNTGINSLDWNFKTWHTINEKIVNALESVGYEISHNGSDQDNALFTMNRHHALPLNLPKWCNDFIF